MNSPEERQAQVIAAFAAMGIKPRPGDGLKPWEKSEMKEWQRELWKKAEPAGVEQ